VKCKIVQIKKISSYSLVKGRVVNIIAQILKLVICTVILSTCF
jgi:hypothetical protein